MAKITYNNSITEVADDKTATIKCAGKKMKSDLVIEYTSNEIVEEYYYFYVVLQDGTKLEFVMEREAMFGANFESASDLTGMYYISGINNSTTAELNHTRNGRVGYINGFFADTGIYTGDVFYLSSGGSSN